MTHLDEGRLLAVRDDEAPDEHLASCALCRESLEKLRARRALVSGALAALDEQGDPVALEGARAAVRRRLAAASAAEPVVVPLARTEIGAPIRPGFDASRRPRRALWTLSRAAGLLLVTAAGLSALPGSPVRLWMSRILAPEASVTPSETRTSPEPAAVAAEETGIRLAVPRGPLRVAILGAGSGTEVRVLWVAGADAAVFAPVGSRFSSGEGRLEAQVTPGAVRVELPRGVVPVSLEVGGRIYLRSTDAGLDVPGPASRRSASEIVFRIP